MKGMYFSRFKSNLYNIKIQKYLWLNDLIAPTVGRKLFLRLKSLGFKIIFELFLLTRKLQPTFRWLLLEPNNRSSQIAPLIDLVLIT